MRLQGRRFILLVIVLLLAPSAVDARGVSVEKTPVEVVRRTFDPGNPPKDMPPLGRRADAVTQIRFGCSTNARYQTISRTRAPSGRSGCTATARIIDLDVRLTLEITIWIPRRARRRLIEHEEGHRIIGERVYETAERSAREEGRKWVGRVVKGAAGTCAAAANAAVSEASRQLCKDYLDATSGRSSRVGERYDTLTDHGRRFPPTVNAAIAQAFEDVGEASPPTSNSQRPAMRHRNSKRAIPTGSLIVEAICQAALTRRRQPRPTPGRRQTTTPGTPSRPQQREALQQ